MTSAKWTAYVLLFFLGFLRTARGTQGLKLIHNGYEGLHVGISEDVSQEYCNAIIHGLKVVMSEFSWLLWQVSEGRASVREVTVSLPWSWRTNDVTCSLLDPVDSVAPPVRPHISVGSETHPLYGSKPWTQQSQGCGRRGDFIQMGADLLRSASNASHTAAARRLMVEWMKFRWGVFDENGRDRDPLYPASFPDPAGSGPRPNRCVSARQPDIPFCDKDNHVPEAPNKHNALCMGRSVWDIIEQSDDFANDRNAASNNSIYHDPIYRYVQVGSPRFVLAVEDTAVMNMQKRWEFVRKAVRRSLVYDVPDGTHMALVVFNSVAHTVAPLSKIDSVSDVRQRIGSSLPRNPSTVPESHKCVLCGLQEAVRALNADPAGTAGANIILLTTGAGTATHHQMDEMVRMVKSTGVRIIPIIYPLTEKPGTTSSSATDSLKPLVEASADEGQRMFTVLDEGVGNDSKVSMMVALMNALLSSFRINAPISSPSTPLVVHSKGYPGGISSLNTGTFTIDDSLGSNVRFSVYYYDLNHVGNTIQLTTPSGDVMASVNMQEEDGDANVIFVNIPHAERGIWSYRLENRADSHQGLHVEVTAKENPERKISLKLWTNVNSGPITIVHNSTPVILYAEVKDGRSPLQNARVRVKLQRLGKNATRFQYEPIYVRLLDNGAGDPDITKGDGVYSRYLPFVHNMPGHYEISVSADDNDGLAKKPTVDSLHRRTGMFNDRGTIVCCGNDLKYEHLKPVSPFRREIIYGVVNMMSIPSVKDVIPPSRILDFKAEVKEGDTDVILRWTAPGDDYDWGQARNYEALLADSWSQAKAFEGERIPNMPIPLEASMEQSFTLSTHRYDQITYLAIRAIDEQGNKGGVSNIASVWVPHPPTTEVPVTTPVAPSASVSAKPQEHSLTQQIRVAGLTLEDAAIIAGAGGGFLIIVVVFTTLCYFHVARKRKEQRKDNEKLEANRNVIVKTNSSLMLSQDDSQDSADSAIKDADPLKEGRSLSPIQSWAASKLLAEHERRFSVTCGPIVEGSGVIANYGGDVHDPFPDVTLIGAHSYASSQTPSTTNSDPPAYQPACVSDAYSAYTYPYHPTFHPEDLPPYTPGISSQSSQISSVYTHDALQPSDIPYPSDIISYQQETVPVISDHVNFPLAQPLSYTHSSETPLRPPLAAKKVPPPVAPKPQISNRPSNGSPTNSSTEPKRRNVTQV